MHNFLSSAPNTHLFVSNKNTFAESGLSAQKLAELPSLPFLMQTLSPHSLYLVLKTADLVENVELVEWIRGTQMQKVLDFDIWEHNSSLETSDISQNAAMSWIQAWLALSKLFAAERFFELEEEIALLILSKFFTILPDGIANITDDIRENGVTTPDKRFFIEPISNDGTDFEILTEFVDALYGADANKAGFLFSAAALLVRQETLELAQKWRNARLADQGFIQRDEAYSSLFSTTNLPIPLAKFKYVPEQDYFIEDATENVIQLLSSLQPEDSIHLIRQALGKDGIKQIAGKETESFENLYDTEFMHDCALYIVKNSTKFLSQLEPEAQSQNSNLLIEKVLQAFQENDEEKFLLLKQKMVRISNTVASALSGHHSYHNNIVTTALIMVRGSLNIGLELCLEQNDKATFTHEASALPDIKNAIQCIESLGLDYVFKLGFNAILDLQKNLLNFLYENKFISTKKLASAQYWLNSNEVVYSSEILLSIEGLLNLIPVCHTELFDVSSHGSTTEPAEFKEMPIYLSQKFKPFEHKSEIVFVQKFIKNIHLNLDQGQKKS